jgi:hypothetical protein
MSTVTNMKVMENTEVISDKFSVNKICTGGINTQKYSTK